MKKVWPKCSSITNQSLQLLNFIFLVLQYFWGSKWYTHSFCIYRIYLCIMHTFFSQILPLKLRCTLYTESFVFMLGHLHNNTKSAKSNNSQFYVTNTNKSRQKVCLALYITSVHVRPWHQSCNFFTIMIENMLHFLEYFDDKVNFMKNFPLGFVEVWSIHLIFWFFEQMQKDLKEKRSCKSSSHRHFESYHVAASLVPGLLIHKNVASIVQMDWVRSCSSKTAEENEENIIKVDVSLNRQNIKWFASTRVTDFRADRARFDILLNFSRKLVFVKNDIETLFFFWKQASK